MKNLLRITAVVFLASAVQFGSVLATGDKGSIRGRENDGSEGDTDMPRTLQGGRQQRGPQGLFSPPGQKLGGFGAANGPASQRQKGAGPSSNVPSFVASKLDRKKIEKEDKKREAAGMAPRFAIPNEVSITPKNDGLWEILGDGTISWRESIKAPGCNSLNFGFTQYQMPDGGSLHICKSSLWYSYTNTSDFLDLHIVSLHGP